MPYLETEITVQASPQRCFEIARDMEKFPEFMPSVDEITVIEKGENWAKTRWVARLQGRPVTWIERGIRSHESQYRLPSGRRRPEDL